MREIDISDLIGIWFHDATINRISVDYVKREVELDYIIPVGFWNSPNRYGVTDGEIKGSLFLTGLLYLVMEAPDARYPYEDSKGIEVTGVGSVMPQAEGELIPKMPQNLPEEAFLQYFYVEEWNSCIFVAATGVHFQAR